jgi:DNA polymerase-3 subunit delta
MARQSGTQPGFNELKAQIRAGQIQRLYVFYGDEDFLIEKLVDSLAEAILTPGSEALDRVMINAGGPASRLDPARLRAEVMTPPFMSGRKLVIVRESGWLAPSSRAQDAPVPTGESDSQAHAGEISGLQDASQDDRAVPAGQAKGRQEAVIKLIEGLPDSVCLVMLETRVDRRLKQLVSLVEKTGLLAEIGREKPQVLQQWISAECRRRGLSIDQAAAESLIDRCDGSMRLIWQELAKLYLYCQASACRQISVQLLADLAIPDLHGSIFDLTDALSDGKTGQALRLLDTLFGQRQPAQLILFMLARHLRQLICAAELVHPERIAKELRVVPFVAARLAGQARRLPPDELETLYGRCQETDVAVKSGQIGDRLALETFLVETAERMKTLPRR